MNLSSISGTGTWLAIAIGMLWLVLIILLSIHLLRRRSGFYAVRPLTSKGAKVFLRALDVFLFLVAVFFALVVVKAFSAGPLAWEIRLAFVSGLLAVIGILILFRESLSLRISDSGKKGRNPAKQTKAKKRSRDVT